MRAQSTFSRADLNSAKVKEGMTLAVVIGLSSSC